MYKKKVRCRCYVFFPQKRTYHEICIHNYPRFLPLCSYAHRYLNLKFSFLLYFIVNIRILGRVDNHNFIHNFFLIIGKMNTLFKMFNNNKKMGGPQQLGAEIFYPWSCGLRHFILNFRSKELLKYGAVTLLDYTYPKFPTSF